jgi:hypothetical protein
MLRAIVMRIMRMMVIKMRMLLIMRRSKRIMMMMRRRIVIGIMRMEEENDVGDYDAAADDVEAEKEDCDWDNEDGKG